MKALSLDRVALNVSDLEQARRFYADALGFETQTAGREDARLASLLGVRWARSVILRRGAQSLELTQTDPAGAPYPPGSASNDLWFQHCALVTRDMRAAYAQLDGSLAVPISRNGPQTLPGGIVAYKFRDPDGHPLELIGFPQPDPRTEDGIDHSAIAVRDAGRSIAFYADLLELRVTSRQVNTGSEQDALDGLDGVEVDVVALCAQHSAPHVELLGYRAPAGRVAPSSWSDLAASRLVFLADRIGVGDASDAGEGASLLRDPDGHAVLVSMSA